MKKKGTKKIVDHLLVHSVGNFRLVLFKKCRFRQRFIVGKKVAWFEISNNFDVETIYRNFKITRELSDLNLAFCVLTWTEVCINVCDEGPNESSLPDVSKILFLSSMLSLFMAD